MVERRDMTPKEFGAALKRRGFESPIDDDSRNGFSTRLKDGRLLCICVSRHLKTRRQILSSLIALREDIENTPPLTSDELDHIRRINRYLGQKLKG